MVEVTAGTFLMGCDPNHNGGYLCSSEDTPLHEVYLDAYRIDKYEVTNQAVSYTHLDVYKRQGRHQLRII